MKLPGPAPAQVAPLAFERLRFECCCAIATEMTGKSRSSQLIEI